ncbi:hypothetical protein M758_4G048700 [Ceratodon purpureus]|nr:hypothetical protein M758_4G048700 [Ceratodon purpureus]
MSGAVDGPSGGGNPTSASVPASGVLSSSSSPRSLDHGTDDGLEAGRSPNPSTPTPSSGMSSRDSLLGSRRETVIESRNSFGNPHFQVDDLGIHLSSAAVNFLMGTVVTIGTVLFTLVVTLAVLLGKCQKPSLPASCASFSLNAEVNNLQGFPLSEKCVNFVARYVDSGQYHSDFAVAVEAARSYLNTIEPDQDGLDIVIFDIDETSLSNMQYYAAHNYGVGGWDEASWNTWVSSAKAPALIPMLSLFTDLKAQNWSVGFITGRPESQGQNTSQNLYNAGYTGWASLILRQPIEETWPAVQYKAKYRTMLENNGYRIRSSLGDQWSDLQGGNTGERTFKLPNPIYYIY